MITIAILKGHDKDQMGTKSDWLNTFIESLINSIYFDWYWGQNRQLSLDWIEF